MTPEIDSYEREILEKCFHPETYDNLKAETTGSEYILGDCIRSLVQKKLLFILEETTPDRWTRRFIYDKDKLPCYRFQSSSKGIDLISSRNS